MLLKARVTRAQARLCNLSPGVKLPGCARDGHYLTISCNSASICSRNPGHRQNRNRDLPISARAIQIENIVECKQQMLTRTAELVLFCPRICCQIFHCDPLNMSEWFSLVRQVDN